MLSTVWAKFDRRYLTQQYLYFLLRHRIGTLVFILLSTTLFGYLAVKYTRIHTDFFELYPPNHPYIQLYQEYRHMFGTANVMMIVLEVKEGDIYTIETVKKIDGITRAIMDTKGVNPFQVSSLTHPSVKNITVTAGGISTLPIVMELPDSEEDLQFLREKVYTSSGMRGSLVSMDDKAVLITAGLWEEGTNFDYLWARTNELRETYEDDNTRLHITGYPMLYTWVHHYRPHLLLVISVTVVVMCVLLYTYFHTLIGVLVPLFSGLLSALWAIGFAGVAGFTLDPLVMVVFVLITARALSHSVQSMERYHEEYARLGNKDQAIISSYVSLFDPAMVSIASDALAIFTLAVARIPVIQNIAFVASFWIVTIVVSVITLHPVLLSYIPPPRQDPKAGSYLSDRFYRSVTRFMVWMSQDSGRRYVSVTVMVLLLTLGIYFSRQLQVSTVSIEDALMYPEHPYNVASRKVNDNFLGASQMMVVVEGKVKEAIKNEDVLRAMEEFQWHMEQEGGATGSDSSTSLLKRVFRMFHEGDPNWEVLPLNRSDIGSTFFVVTTFMASNEVGRLYSHDYQNAIVTLYYQDYSNSMAKHALSSAKDFIDANPQETVGFRLAGGLMGVLAAMNEEIAASYKTNLMLILVAIFALSLLTYRSVIGALIVMQPPIVAQPIIESIMYFSGIDMNINSLPVAAVGIGIGIDYAYYVLSRIVEEYGKCEDFDEANRRALATTGRAVFFTGFTLIGSVVLWILFPMKFQAEMAFLLGTVLVFHVIGSLIFIPALVRLIKPRFVVTLGKRLAAEARAGAAAPQPAGA